MTLITDKTFHVEIITPERLKFSDDVNAVSLPGMEGQMALLANHAPILALLDPGVLTIRTRAAVTRMAVGGGFAKMSANRAVVLVEFAQTSDEIDAASVEQELAAVGRELAERTSSPERDAAHLRQRALRARLEVARRKDSV